MFSLPRWMVAVFLAALCGTLPASAAQLKASWTLIDVKVTGETAYSPQEIMAGAGLQLGQTVSEEDFKQATGRLGETGLFGNVMYSFRYSPAGVKLELQVADGSDMVPALYDNLVWFSDAELLDKIRARVPLFRGQVPLDGNLEDQVSDALQALVIQRGVHGQIEYLREGPENEPIEAVIYTLHAHNIRVRNTDFSGAGPQELPLLREAGKVLENQEYSVSGVRVYIKHDFMPVFQRRGYLKATFGTPSAKVVEDGPEETSVDVTVPVTPGTEYRLKDVQWSGNTVFPAAQLASFIKLKPGEPVNAPLLMENLHEVAKLYSTRGYMRPKIEPEAKFDDQQATVEYDIPMVEGDVYKMGELEVRGLDTRTTDRVAFMWKLHEGDVYDSSYFDRFRETLGPDIPKDVTWKIDVREIVDEKDKTVDVSLLFVTGGTQ